MPKGHSKRYHAVTGMRKFEFALSATFLLLAACRETKTHAQAPEPPAVVFEMRTFETSRPGCGDHGNRTQACVSFRAVWPEMKGGAEGAARMNAAVLAALGFPSGPESLAPYGEELIEHWRVEHKGVVYADSSWFERRMVQVIARRPGVWSFLVQRIGQTGKALPFDERTYLNLDPRTGAPVALDSLLASHAGARFASLAEAGLRAALNLAPDAPLPLKEQQFALPAEFALSPAGVVLAWSGQALRDPASARIEITLPWSQTRELVSQTAVKPPTPEAEQGF
jgi:hypothetical protein